MSPAVILSTVVLIAVTLMFWQGRRDRALVREWATREGWALLDVVPARLHRHPDFLSVRITQRPAFRIRVSSDEHGHREGVLMLGRGFILSTLRHAYVSWDDGRADRGFPVVPLDRPR